jgi:integrase
LKGTIRKDKNGTYSYLVCIGKDPLTNKYKYKRKRGFKLKKECEAALAELITEVTKGTVIDNEKMTVEQYLDYWNETYVKPNCSDNTILRYSFSIADIKKYLGSIKLCKLNPLLIEKFYKDVVADKGQSQNTLLKTHRTFHLALKHAQQWQLIHTNYCDLVNKPKEIKKDIEFWNPKDIKANLKKLQGSKLYNISFLAVHTGLRVGELCGLKWKDVDFKHNTIKVQEQLQKKRETKKLTQSNLKTTTSYRIVTLYPSTVEFLKNLRNTTTDYCENDSNIINFDAKKDISEVYVFHWEDDGRPMDPHYVSQKFKGILSDCGINDSITFHGLRHTHATMLLASGVKEKVISERLGHSTVAFTMDVYTHVNIDMQKEEIKKISKFL